MNINETYHLRDYARIGGLYYREEGVEEWTHLARTRASGRE